jgi:hypothetical protein
VLRKKSVCTGKGATFPDYLDVNCHLPAADLNLSFPQVNMLRIVQLLRSSLLILITVVAQGIQFLRWALTSRAALSAEVLFLRKQLVFYQEHRIPPGKLTAAARFSLLLWSRFFNWREALMIVKPDLSSNLRM